MGIIRHIIITGDDFGMTERCSLAIVRAFHEELITHTSMAANGAFFEEAVGLARDEDLIDRIGIHFNLTEGTPLTRKICGIPGFVVDGRFHKGCMRDPRELSETEKTAVLAELCAQAERIIHAGIPLSHADSHHYVHNLKTIAPLVAIVCKNYGVKRIRLNRTFDSPEHPRITKNRVDNAYWHEHGFVTTAHFGRSADFVKAQIPDNTEIMVHPDFDRDGFLIDRDGTEGGYAAGKKLRRFI